MSSRTRIPVSRATTYLKSRARFGQKLGLETVTALVEALGRPERRYPTLLVAGTNGKGSVVAYTDSALRASGLRVGRYTSPHLVRVNERIAVDGTDIADEDLDTAVEAVRETAEGLVRRRTIPAHPTFFEVMTAAAFEHFRRASVDVAVLEVGMGGRLDATNASEPLVSAIVSVERDHEKYLGKTLAAIAREKAGVLRTGRATVLGPMASEAREAIDAEARRLKARLLEAQAHVSIRETTEGLHVTTPRREYRGLRPLPGVHQIDNAVVALRLLEEAQEAGLPVDLDTAAVAFTRTLWPGRLEWIPGEPPLLLDGAHNPSGARALASHLRTLGPFVLLFGVMEDKDVAQMARSLLPLADSVVLTSPRAEGAASPQAIVLRAGATAAGAQVEASPRKALALARRLARTRGCPVVVAGSLYLVGEVLSLLAGQRPSRGAPRARV